jgi:hypothetical protein
MASLYSAGLRARNAQPHSPQRIGFGDSFASNCFSRSWRSIRGSGMRIGHTSSQRPQSVDAFGRWPASPTPIRLGISTAPIGPEYTQPYAWPPTAAYTGQWLMQAPQRMQRSISLNSLPSMLVRPLSSSRTWYSSGPSRSSGRFGPVVKVV